MNKKEKENMKKKNIFISLAPVIIFLMPLMPVSGQTGLLPQGIEIPLWPDGPGESNGITIAETTNDAGHVYNISDPSITIYPADNTKNTGIAVLLCPGGGYEFVAAKHEGTYFAKWLAENGITGIVLKYRLPNGHHNIPLADVSEAMRITRKNATAWNIDKDKIGVMGFSAGGHLASTLLTHFDKSTRPDFGILVYPNTSYSEADKGGRKLMGDNPDKDLLFYYSNDKHVNSDTPPTLLLHSHDDTIVPSIKSTIFYEALHAQKVPAGLYIFPSGGHGWGFDTNFKYHKLMKEIVLDWIFSLK